jgi:hypothetical protein
MLPRTRTPSLTPSAMPARLKVVIVDSDVERSNNTAAMVRAANAIPTVARDMLVAVSLWTAADAVILDDDAFGLPGLVLAASCARHAPNTRLCIAARAERFAAVRAIPAYVLFKPFLQASIDDALDGARSRVVTNAS